MENQYIKTNQSLWNSKVDYHTASDFYQLENFKNGWNSLRHIEMKALGNKVKDKSMLHLQCHFGQDSLAWTRLGAQVTGIDFSEKAINVAKSLNAELGLNAKFIQSNVYDVREKIQEQFDIVFTSYGVLGWLPDMNKWAEVVAQSVKSGGIFYIVEFHPGLMIYDLESPKPLRLEYDYFHNPEPDLEIVDGTYANREAKLKHKEYTWSHSMAEIIQPLLNQGLMLETFNEYPYSTWNCFSNLHELGEEQFVFGKLDKTIPHLFELVMKKP